uniref:C2H2-type domain-containing protein n=2 Tax=Stomoxys calcitrans TaxID=35570 RepID=A0A1I8P8J5_STOCA
MEWEGRLQYICGKCWQHISEFHQFQESIIEAQKDLHLRIAVVKEAEEVVKVKSELNINQQKEQMGWHVAKELSATTEEFMKHTTLAFDIKTEEPLDLNSDYEELSASTEELKKPALLTFHIKTEEPLDLNSDYEDEGQLTDGEMSPISNRKENSMSYDESNEDYSSNNDDRPSSSMGQTNICSSDKKFSATKKSVEEFDELVALWRNSLQCEICHQLASTYSQLKEHFSKNHASEGCCYLMCCQLRLESRYDIENHIRYHNAPQQLRCDACCKAFRMENLLRNHKRNVHTSKGGDRNSVDSEKSEGKYRCDKCSKSYATRKHLYNHNLCVHKPKTYECNICDKSYVRPDALREHLASHKGEKTHACSFCPEAFTCRTYFRVHMKKYHNQEWKKMQNEAAQKETRKGYCRETRGERVVYVCIYCSKECDKRISMYYHAKRCQIDGGPTEPKKGFRLETRGEGIVHVCIYCSMEYEKRHSMYLHLNQCHKDDVSLAEKQAPMISDSPMIAEQQQQTILYKCQLCPEQYKTRASLYSHRRRIHKPKNANINQKKSTAYKLRFMNLYESGANGRFRCKTCSKEYEKKISLYTHIRRLHPLPQESQEELEKNSVYVKTEQYSANTNANEEMDEHEMPTEFQDATWNSEEFIKSEKEIIEL